MICSLPRGKATTKKTILWCSQWRGSKMKRANKRKLEQVKERINAMHVEGWGGCSKWRLKQVKGRPPAFTPEQQVPPFFNAQYSGLHHNLTIWPWDPRSPQSTQEKAYHSIGSQDNNVKDNYIVCRPKVEIPLEWTADKSSQSRVSVPMKDLPNNNENTRGQ